MSTTSKAGRRNRGGSPATAPASRDAFPLIAALLPSSVEGEGGEPSSLDFSLLPWSEPEEMHARYLAYKKAVLSPSEYAFLARSTKDGDNSDVAFGDRIAALTVAVQEAGLPFCVPFLRSLLAVAASTRRREAAAAMAALCQLYEPVSALGSTAVVAFVGSVWRAKEAVYENVVRLLEVHVQDQLVHAREAACRLLYTLLMASSKLGSGPHLGTRLHSMCVALVVSRMSDPERKIASRMPWYLLQAIQAGSRDSSGSTLSLAAVRATREAVAGALADVLRGKQQGAGDRAGYRAIYYGMTLFVQLEREKLIAAIAPDLLATYGLLLEHFILSPTTGSAELKRDRKRRNHQDGHKAATMHSHEFGRIAKLLLIGLSQTIPIVAASKDLAVLREKIVLPLRRFVTKDCSATPFSVLCQSIYLLACLPREENDNLERMVEVKLLLNPLLIHHRSLHAMVASLVAKIGSDALTKRAFQLHAMGILQAAPKANCSLQVQLSIPDDAIEDERCLWELPALAQGHYSGAARAYFAALIKGPPGSAAPADDDAAAFLSAWADLNHVHQYAFLRHYASSSKSRTHTAMEDFDGLPDGLEDVDDDLNLDDSEGDVDDDLSIDSAPGDSECSDAAEADDLEIEEHGDSGTDQSEGFGEMDRHGDLSGADETAVGKGENTKKGSSKMSAGSKRGASVFAFADEFDF